MSGECLGEVGPGRSAEMSLYDQHRSPHSAVSDSTEITITPRSLASELMCPICLDMLNTTMTTKECLHRFCLNCITTALRSGNKECPTCRKKLVSRRSLRPDPNFDALIAKIYPNRDEYDAMQQRAFQRLSKHTNTEAFQKSMEECLRHQALLRKKQKINPGDFEYKKRVRKRKEEAGGVEETPSSQENSGSVQPQEGEAEEGEMGRESSIEPSASETSESLGAAVHQQEIELILRPHPDLERDSLNTPSAVRQTRFLKTTGNATVDHISKYVAMRVKLDQEEANRVEAALGGTAGFGPTPLPPSSHSNPLLNPNTSLLSNNGVRSHNSSVPGGSPLSEANHQDRPPNDCSRPVTSNPQPKPHLSEEAREDGSWAELSNGVANDSAHYHIFINPGIGSNKQYTPLDGSWTLSEVRNQYWRVKKPLELQFRVDGSELDRQLFAGDKHRHKQS